MYNFSSYSLPNNILACMESEKITGSGSTYATFPLNKIYPSTNCISLSNDSSIDDLPDPTLPIIVTNYPYRILKFILLSTI